MLRQLKLIERVKEMCKQDDRVDAAMMYGSFAKGSGDEYSDIEFVLFISDNELPSINQHKWLEQIAPVEICYVNEWGIVSIIFSNLVRGEFHFKKVSEIEVVGTWTDTDWFPNLESTLVVDKTGKLFPHLSKLIGDPPERCTQERLQFVVNSFFNWYVFGHNLLRRGELAHSHSLLWIVHRQLLWMARTLERSIENWPTPVKKLEQDISQEAYNRYCQCACGIDSEALHSAYLHTWNWGMDMIDELRWQYELTVPDSLIGSVGSRLSDL